MKNDLLAFEKKLWNKSIGYIAGIDEVGRGAFAGPMVVAAVILSKNHLEALDDLNDELKLYTQINDFKLLTPKKRGIISDFLQKESLSYSIVEISNDEIDKIGLTSCTQKLFYESVLKLSVKPEHILTDTFEIKSIDRTYQTNITKGDTKSITIAAASIIAKVYRDNLMIKIHNMSDKYKVYGFDKHKGYGTKLHREMIEKYGYSDLHRQSFHFKK
ncbi:hypothetical protein A2V49_03540 [candidate division WWE3 bacterium RBG_19FT_COMBO_34_6]|uniref:Ribonuclease n=1 Tax=candidate division WWE3 bacterium RBG_19FT_COMBO_34_6 TaxID=1802612 RepID=A0A1F4UME4_UNCKA|nr:MAG: hypothetical protein A2V49_03540 [candidate division WWE3 bacterium RBG_19FT_COMBO_34_6]